MTRDWRRHTVVWQKQQTLCVYAPRACTQATGHVYFWTRIYLFFFIFFFLIFSVYTFRNLFLFSDGNSGQTGGNGTARRRRSFAVQIAAILLYYYYASINNGDQVRPPNTARGHYIIIIYFGVVTVHSSCSAILRLV